MKVVVWILLGLLVVVHQLDLVNASRTLVADFLPLPLVYHAGLSVAAAVVWFLVTRFAWPEEAEPEVSSSNGEPKP